MRRGRVEAFDEARGLGTVRAEPGGESLGFHCTSIADGSRRVPTGATVLFREVPGDHGCWEAAELTVINAI